MVLKRTSCFVILQDFPVVVWPLVDSEAMFIGEGNEINSVRCGGRIHTVLEEPDKDRNVNAPTVAPAFWRYRRHEKGMQFNSGEVF